MKQKNNGGKAVIKNLLISIFSFIFLLLFINTYFISATKISGESMFPSFTTGDHVMFSKISTPPSSVLMLPDFFKKDNRRDVQV